MLDIHVNVSNLFNITPSNMWINEDQKHMMRVNNSKEVNLIKQ